MKLVLYSGGHDFENTELDQELLKLSKKRKPQITFIPACSYMGRTDYPDFVRQYSKYNVTRFINFPIDVPYTEILQKEAFKSDIIHLSGGNTYYFLKYLKKKKLLGELKKFVARGGVLSGLSAGAIIMTPNIETAGFPSFDKDENEENLRNLKSLSLVPFEFFPHYKNSKRYENELIKYSKNLKHPLYAAIDGAGIIKENQTIRFIGRVFCFYQGKKFKMNA